MKRTLAIILALVLCVGVFATVGFAAENDTYELKTELKDGDKVVIYNRSVGLAISTEIEGTYYCKGVEVSPADGKLVNPDEALVWTVEVVEGGIKLKNAEGKAVAVDGTYTNLNTNAATPHDVWAVKPATTANSVYLENTTAKGNSGDAKVIQWSTYKSNKFSVYYYSEASEAVFAMELYVLKTAEPETPVANKITVHAQVPEGWTNANIWAWRNADGSNAFEGSGWPGNAMELKDGWYEIEIPADIDRVIINNGSEQTVNLTVEAGKEVWVSLTTKGDNGQYSADIAYTNPNPAPSTPAEKPEDNKENSKTGDATALVAISAAMLLAATGVVAVVSNKKHF